MRLHRDGHRLLMVLAMGVGLLGGFQTATAQIRIQMQPPTPVAMGRSTSLFVEDRRRSRALVQAIEMVNSGDLDRGILQLQTLLELKNDSFVAIRLKDSSVKLTPEAEEGEEANGPQPPVNPFGPGFLPPGGVPQPGVNPETEQTEPVQYRGLKAEVLRQIATLPADGRKLYQDRYGERAAAIYRRGMEGDLEALQEVVRRFFFTKAGHDAAYALASYHLDRGESFASALLLDRIRKSPLNYRDGLEPYFSLKLAVSAQNASNPELARTTLRELKALAGTTVKFGANTLPMFREGQDELKWLSATLGELAERNLLAESWMSLRGSPDGQSVSKQASLAWEPKSTANMLEVKEFVGLLHLKEGETFKTRLNQLSAYLKSHRDGAKAADRALLAATHPLMVGDQVFARSLTGTITSHDVTSGEFAWMTMFDTTTAFALLVDTEKHFAPIRTPYQEQKTTEPFDQYVRDRSWMNLTAGSLTTDGRAVYGVSRVGLIGATRTDPSKNNSYEQGGIYPETYNELQACNIATHGELLWVAGGPPNVKGATLAGHFFLGPPLPLNGLLYVLAEYDGEIRLCCLREGINNLGRATAEVVWTQSIVGVEETVETHAVRRLSGLTPSYSDGVMICPTTSGAVVAIDLAQQMLLWGHAYDLKRENDSMSNLRMRQLQRSAPLLAVSDERWTDSNPVISGGAVLFTPADSDMLYCVSLAEGGKLLWKRSRGDGLYLAGVHNGIAIVVGTSQVKGYRISDGSDAWSDPVPIAVPTGRGYMVNNFYHLPLTTGEIATIDIRNGTVQALSRGPENARLGNLIAVDGRLVSLSIEQLVVFESITEQEAKLKQQLKNNPADAEALAMRGELLLLRGETQAALAELMKSVQIKPNKRVQNLIAERLLEDLRTDPVNGFASVETVRKYIATPEQESRLLRLEATWLLSQGRELDAVRKFLDVGATRQSARVTGSHVARADRWARSHLEELFRSDAPELLTQVDEVIRSTVEEAAAAGDTEKLRVLINLLGQHPMAETARRELAAQLGPVEKIEDQQARREMLSLLTALQYSEDKTVAGSATAGLFELYHSWKQERIAIDKLKKLQGLYSDVLVRNEQTGSDFAAKVLDDHPALKVVFDQPPRGWPNKRFEATATRKTNSIQISSPIANVGPLDDEYRYWEFALDQQRQSLLGIDELGTIRFKYRLPTRVSVNYSSRVLISDHVLVFTFNGEFHVVDLLGKEGTAELLWKGKLVDSVNPSKISVSRAGGKRPLNRAQNGYTVTDERGNPLGEVGVLTSDLMVYQRGLDLLAVEPRTGEVLWERSNLPRGCMLTGRGDYVCAWDPASNSSQVFLASDGRQVLARFVQIDGDLLDIAESNSIGEWTSSEKTTSLLGRNLLDGKVIWSHDFSSAAKITPVESDEVAILEPAFDKQPPRISIVRLRDGEIVLQRPLDEVGAELTSLKGFEISRSANDYLVLTSILSRPPENKTVSPVGQKPWLVNGPVVCLDRETKDIRWTTYVPSIGFDRFAPSSLPVVVLASRVSEWKNDPNRGRRVTSTSYEYRILDRRTGRIIDGESHSSSVSLNRYNIVADPNEQKIDVNFYKLQVSLKMSEKPAAEPVKIDEAIEELKESGTFPKKVDVNQPDNIPPVPMPIRIQF